MTATLVRGPGESSPGTLERALRARRDRGAKLLVPYVMAGMVPGWVEVLHAAAEAGADALEVGIPFSDPVMDGPVIQQAGTAALAAGTTPQGVVDALAGADLGVPLVVMTYYNLVFRAGHRRMARSLAAAGVAGAILADLPLEELGPWASAADEAGVETVLLVAPSTPPARVAAICARCRGFVYAVARMGVTGERADLGADVAAVVGRVRDATDLPVCAGVGVSTPAQAAEACRVADGVVVGSALVRRLLEGGGADAALRFVGELRQALDDVAAPGH
ncbi:MAG TPA: tryptophan synthase subunit alpha [Acidimicrobiales bacterium]|nr:tryptophan synthase subunit alpha [Acidimicrobiales bacterium]